MGDFSPFLTGIVLLSWYPVENGESTLATFGGIREEDSRDSSGSRPKREELHEKTQLMFDGPVGLLETC